MAEESVNEVEVGGRISLTEEEDVVVVVSIRNVTKVIMW